MNVEIWNALNPKKRVGVWKMTHLIKMMRLPRPSGNNSWESWVEWAGSSWPLNLKEPFRCSHIRLRLAAVTIEQEVSVLQGPSPQEEQHGRRQKALEDNLDPPASSSARITILYATSLLYMMLGTEPSMNFWYARPTLPNVLHLQK